MNILPAEVRGREAKVDGHVIALKSQLRQPALLAPRQRSASVPEFVETVAPAPGLLAQRSNASTISAVSALRRAHLGMQNSRRARRRASPAGRHGRAEIRSSHVHVYADSLLVEEPPDGQDRQPKSLVPVLPVFLVVAFSAVLPLMTVVNYSMQDTFGNNQFFWNGVGWFKNCSIPRPTSAAASWPRSAAICSSRW